MKISRRASLTACVAAIGALAIVPAAQAKSTQYYVSLGDSYASGYQPGKGNTKEGFVYQVPALAKKRGYNLKVVNFGCAGATTKSMMEQIGCTKAALGPGAKPFNKTQIAAATDFIKANRKKVALITVSISGNDVTKCVSAADPITCVAEAQAAIKANIGTAAKQLRAAAGSKPVMVGTTYPDVVLGAWVNPGGAGAQNIANLSVVAFKSLINPTLKASYAEGKGKFVDVTAKTGAYGDMNVTETLAPYGSIPKPVADVCRITWYCEKRDIHANKAGYAIIAKMVAAELPKR
jgi:lysophospholipase L1-like esterase